jgi:hypothetical protein
VTIIIAHDLPRDVIILHHTALQHRSLNLTQSLQHETHTW